MLLNELNFQNIHIKSCRSGLKHPDNFHVYYEKLVSVEKEEGGKKSLGSFNVCRFCGETDHRKFKKNNAHAFPEFTGNNWLFTKQECKECNDLFSLYEGALANHSMIVRTMLGMKTKKGKTVKYKTKSKTTSVQRNSDGYKMLIDSSIKPTNSDDGVTLNVKFGEEISAERINISMPEVEYVPLHLYKALLKIAISIMPEDEYFGYNFNKIKNSLLETTEVRENEDDGSNPYFNIYHSRLPLAKREPYLVLFKKLRKFINYNAPTYSFYFMYGSDAYQIFLPFAELDNWLAKQPNINLHVIPELLLWNNQKENVTWINGNSTAKTKYKPFNFSVRRK